MSAPNPVPAERLAELLVSAAADLTASTSTFAPTPCGVPVRQGRLHLGRLAHRLAGHDRLAVVAGFATAAWIGPPAAGPPPLGPLTYRADTTVDARGRVLVDFRARRWLAVADTHDFEVVVVADATGLLIVPTEDFARRWSEVIG